MNAGIINPHDSSTLPPADIAALNSALELLENPGLIARISNFLGTPIEALIGTLPKGASRIIDAASDKALRAALRVAIATMSKKKRHRLPSLTWHRGLSALSGAAGGAFGLPALAVELPVTTTIIMRSIAQIGLSEGEDFRSPAARMACLEVFAFGGRSTGDDDADNGYFAVRAAMAHAVGEAVGYLGRKEGISEGAPVIIRLLSRIAARFNTVVSEKILAQGVPIVGAIGGAGINVLFMKHFQDMARGHFIIRRLERTHGTDVVIRYSRLIKSA